MLAVLTISACTDWQSAQMDNTELAWLNIHINVCTFLYTFLNLRMTKLQLIYCIIQYGIRHWNSPFTTFTIWKCPSYSAVNWVVWLHLFGWLCQYHYNQSYLFANLVHLKQICSVISSVIWTDGKLCMKILLEQNHWAPVTVEKKMSSHGQSLQFLKSLCEFMEWELHTCRIFFSQIRLRFFSSTNISQKLHLLASAPTGLKCSFFTHKWQVLLAFAPHISTMPPGSDAFSG